MDLNKLKIELINKLINATQQEKEEILKKAKEIIERDKSEEVAL